MELIWFQLNCHQTYRSKAKKAYNHDDHDGWEIVMFAYERLWNKKNKSYVTVTSLQSLMLLSSLQLRQTNAYAVHNMPYLEAPAAAVDDGRLDKSVFLGENI